jgi:hypothetical protein
MPWKGVVSLLGELAVVSLLGELAVQSVGDSLGELPPTTGIVALKCFDEVLIDTEKQLSAGFERLFWFLRECATCWGSCLEVVLVLARVRNLGVFAAIVSAAVIVSSHARCCGVPVWEKRSGDEISGERYLERSRLEKVAHFDGSGVSRLGS